MRWLANHRSDPSTKMALKKRHLAPNLALRSAIEGWVASESATRCAFVSCSGLPAAVGIPPVLSCRQSYLCAARGPDEARPQHG